jgi:hypothetical protein
MKSNNRLTLLLFILFLSLPLSGCLLSAQGGPGRVIYTDGAPPPPPNIKHGPPPHAKAHGLRAKYHYRYYPDTGVYFDTGRSVYFYLGSNGTWRMAVSLPRFLKVQLGDNVTIVMETDRPYSQYPDHKKKYPPKKNKKHKKNKW